MKFYFTFGSGHKHENCYIEISAPDYGAAREAMFQKFGDKWCFQYSEEEWRDASGQTLAERYNMRELVEVEAIIE